MAMEMNPQRVRTTEFKTVRKGADPDEVRSFLNDVADELERAQNQATAMEARARAAVARLQEVNGEATAPSAVEVRPDEAETISRTLVLAQRTADTTIAEAKEEAARTLDSTREMAAAMLEEARVEARIAGASERQSIAEEVEALRARRDFLEADVHHLETFLADQRARVREAATSLIELADRVPGGLGAARSPLLSAADDDTGEIEVDEIEVDEIEVVAIEIDEIDTVHTVDSVDTEEAGAGRDPWSAADEELEDRGANESDTDRTQALPVVDAARDDEEFRFSFDDERR
jgi:cell division initiation protein